MAKPADKLWQGIGRCQDQDIDLGVTTSSVFWSRSVPLDELVNVEEPQLPFLHIPIAVAFVIRRSHFLRKLGC